MFLALFALALVIAMSPPQCGLPDRERCTLAHGFVIGAAPPFPGTVEIWNCSGRTVVTLNQVRGREPGSGPLPRAFFCPELASGERLMGCRGGDENFDGTIAIASGAGGNRPELRSAWVADTDEWKFVPGKRDDWICNRGLTAN